MICLFYISLSSCTNYRIKQFIKPYSYDLRLC